jgi:hypothetical protein
MIASVEKSNPGKKEYAMSTQSEAETVLNNGPIAPIRRIAKVRGFYDSKMHKEVSEAVFSYCEPSGHSFDFVKVDENGKMVKDTSAIRLFGTYEEIESDLEIIGAGALPLHVV